MARGIGEHRLGDGGRRRVALGRHRVDRADEPIVEAGGTLLDKSGDASIAGDVAQRREPPQEGRGPRKKRWRRDQRERDRRVGRHNGRTNREGDHH